MSTMAIAATTSCELDKAIVSQDVRPANEADENPVEKFDAILQELLVLTRSQSQILSSPQQLFPLDQILETVDRHRRQNGLPEKNHPVWRDIARKFEDLKEIIRLVPPSPECMLLHSLASELEDALNYVLRRIESSVRIRRVEENPTLKRIDALGRRVEINVPSRRRPSIAERLFELSQTDAAQGRSEALAEEVDPQK